MEKISNILPQKIKKTESKKPLNLNFEKAQEFGKYVGLNTFFVIKLFKLYGINRVLRLISWLGDINCDRKRMPGLVVWKLKQNCPLTSVQ